MANPALSKELPKWHFLTHTCNVMVLLGLLGDVHKDNFTWNLKAFDEFQSLLNLPVRFEAGFSSKLRSFHKSR
jgi:hypothetical protein